MEKQSSIIGKFTAILRKLNRVLFALLLLNLFLAGTVYSQSPKTALARRWYRNLYAVNNSYWAQTPAGLTQAKSLAAQASQHGFNGVVVPIHLFFLSWNTATQNNFKDYVTYCQGLGLEVVPDFFPINSAGMVFNRNFAEADPIDTLRLIAGTDSLRPVQPATNLVLNDGLESYTGNTFSQYLFQDKAGTCTFADAAQKYQGNSSIRFENFAANNGMVRLCQHIVLKPNAQYRFRFMLKKTTCPGSVRVLVIGKNFSNEIQRFDTPSADTDIPWTQYSFEFTTSTTSDLNIYLGTWGGTSGQFWIDNIEIMESPSLFNIVRRAGTPLYLKNTSGTVTYKEYIDFDSIRNLSTLAAIALKPGSQITNGQQLILSCYRAADYNNYKAICMSNEAMYSFFGSMSRQLYTLYNFKKIFLYIDEIRCGGSCLSCKNSGKSTAQILGNCVTRFHDTLRVIDPTLEVITWADMLDPNWNAKNHYYKIVGDLSGSWNYIPKDITIVPWGACGLTGSTSVTFLKNSLDHFVANGFNNVMGCGYYDTHSLSGTANWIHLLSGYTQSRGLIYSTWTNPPDFTQLNGFGDMMMDSINTDPTQAFSQQFKTSATFDVTPNPFSNVSTIQVILDIRAYTLLDIYSLDGSHVKKLVSTTLDAGTHTFYWQGEDDKGNMAAAGVYVYRLMSGEAVLTKKGILEK